MNSSFNIFHLEGKYYSPDKYLKIINFFYIFVEINRREMYYLEEDYDEFFGI